MKAKWAFYLGVADPDYIKRADENRQTRYRIVEEELIRVWLQKRHGKEKRFRIYTGHLTTTQERERFMAPGSASGGSLPTVETLLRFSSRWPSPIPR